MSSTPSTDHQVNGGTPSVDADTAKNTSTNGTTTAEDLKASLSTLKQAEDKPRLSNGHSGPHLESSSSIDEAPSSEGTLTEGESTLSEPSPRGSPIVTEKTSRQVSHEREDSTSSLGDVGGADSELSVSQFPPMDSNSLLVSSRSKIEGSEPSSRIGKNLVAEGEPKPREDSDPPSSEVAVAYSPGGRFLKYDVEIGRGSFKTVYKGLDTETGVAIAWCELQEKRYNKAEQARFKEEVSILKTLQHPNILKLYDSWESTPGHGGQKKDKVKDKVLVLVTELMTSGTLKSYMRRLKSIKPKVIRSWGRQILKGLYFLHTRMPPIIHRDLKCDNIFINGTTGLVKIGDLGLATLKRNDVTTVIGTPEFMAPEMYEESYDESVDVYAFGMCLLEMCTQEYPYMECSNPAQIYKRVSQGIKPHAIDKIKDASLREIIERCTTVDKEKRFTVLDLLNHEYFSENFKIEVVQGSEPSDTQPTEPNGVLTVRMNVPNQEANKKNGQESIEFPYDLAKDVPEDVVREMVKSGILHSSLQQMVFRSLRDYVDSVKQKLQGRNKAENPNAEGKLVETKSETFSHTPSPSPGMSTEAAPSDPDPSVVQVQRQPSALSESVKTEEIAAVKEPAQGLDMTGQGAIPPTSEKDRSLPLSVSKVPESKPNELLSPVGSSGTSEHAPLTGQLVTASTGQAVPQAGLTKDPSTKSQTNVHAVDSKSYSSAVKEGGPSTERQSNGGTSVDKAALDTSQESSHLKPAGQSDSVLAAPIQEMHIHSDTSAESTPVHQPPQSDAETSVPGATGGGTGTLKKKGSQRGKSKGIRLTLVEHSSDNKLVCQLATSNGKLLKYQFSMKYDRPEEMFKKFVKGEFLTEADKNEFIQQSNQLIQSAKKGRDSSKSETQESKPHNLAIQEQRSRSSTEPALSPPSEVAEPTPKAPTEQSTESKPSKTALVPSYGSPKLDLSKSVSVPPSEHTEPQNVETSSTTSEGWATPMVTPEPREISNPLASNSASSLNGVSTTKPQPQAENVSTLGTHTTTPHESPRPQSPSIKIQQALQNTLIAGAPADSLSSCSLPSMYPHFQVPTGVQMCTQFPTTSAPRVFEVVTVNEDKPDSPEISDLSANGSTENLGKEPQRSDSQDSTHSQNVVKRFVVPSVPSLESKSDSYIGKNTVPMDITATRHQLQDQTMAAPPSTVQPQPERSKSPRHNSVSYVLPTGLPRHASQGPRTVSVPEYYRTTSFLETGSARQRGGITEETYVPLQSTRGGRAPQDPRVFSQEHYSTTSALESGPRGGITEDTYVHPMYRHYPSSNTIHSYPPYPTSESEVLAEENGSYPMEHYPQQFDIDELPQASLLSEAFMRFMHSMSTVFRDPTFQPLISSLDRRFNPLIEPGSTRTSRQEYPSEVGPTRNTRHEYPSEARASRHEYPSEARPSRHEYPSEPGYTRISRQEPPVFRATTDPGQVPAGGDPESEELRAALEEIEEERKKLDIKRKQMIEDFQRRKHSSGNSSLESSSGLPDSRKISTTSYDSYTTSSPTQGRRFGKVTEDEEAGTGSDSRQGSPAVSHKPGSVPAMAEMERRVRDELMTDKLRSDTSSPSHFDYNPARSRTPQHPPPPRTSSSNVVQPDHGGSLSPSYQTSPPPTQTVGVSTFQVQTSPSSTTPQAANLAKIGHLDSSEWTEYTSAPVPQQVSGYVDSRTGTPTSGANLRGTVTSKSSVPVSSNSRADVSEFDPITSHSQFARPKS